MWLMLTTNLHHKDTHTRAFLHTEGKCNLCTAPSSSFRRMYLSLLVANFLLTRRRVVCAFNFTIFPFHSHSIQIVNLLRFAWNMRIILSLLLSLCAVHAFCWYFLFAFRISISHSRRVDSNMRPARRQDRIRCSSGLRLQATKYRREN